MSNKPLVSVVVPTVGRWSVRKAVQSVVTQGEAVEVLVVLDRPGGREIVDEALRGLGAQLLCTRGGVGGGAARNYGAQFARGEYLCFLDDDDWWEPGKLETQLEAISGFRGYGEELYWSATAMRFHRRTRIDTIPRTSWDGESDLSSYLVQRTSLRFGAHAMQTSSLLVSRALWDLVKWDEGLAKHQDWDFMARCARLPNTRFVWIDRPLVNVVQDSKGSVSKSINIEAGWTWLERHHDAMSSVAIGDFAATQLLRASLRSRSWKSARRASGVILHHRPHLSALLVGLAGIVRR